MPQWIFRTSDGSWACALLSDVLGPPMAKLWYWVAENCVKIICRLLKNVPKPNYSPVEDCTKCDEPYIVVLPNKKKVPTLCILTPVIAKLNAFSNNHRWRNKTSWLIVGPTLVSSPSEHHMLAPALPSEKRINIDRKKGRAKKKTKEMVSRCGLKCKKRLAHDIIAQTNYVMVKHSFIHLWKMKNLPMCRATRNYAALRAWWEQ